MTGVRRRAGRVPARRTAVDVLIGVVAVITACLVLGSCSNSAGGGGRARAYIQSHYERQTSLDEGDVDAYLADGSVSSVAGAIAGAERPTDKRAGASGVSGPQGYFLQYPDYIVALFPSQGDRTRVMLSRDYRSGYTHYHSYVGGFWVPTPRFAGRGDDFRGGGSGSGGK